MKRSSLWSFCAGLLGALILVNNRANGQVDAGNMVSDLPSILKVLKLQSGKLKSMQCTLIDTSRRSAEYAALKNAQDSTITTNGGMESSQVEWAFKDDKQYRKGLLDPGSGTGQPDAPTETIVYDGAKTFSIVSYGKRATGQANVSEFRSNHLSPLSFGYQLDGCWLMSTISSGRFKTAGTVGSTEFGELVKIEGDVPLKGRIRFFLSPRFNWLAIRTEQDEPSGKQRLVYETKKLEQYDHIWVPVSGSLHVLQRNGENTTPLIERELQASAITVNSTPDSLFVPQLPTGTEVRDGQSYYKIGADGRKIAFEARPRPASEMPIGWLFIGSLTSMTVIGLGAIVQWRRRTDLLSH